MRTFFLEKRQLLYYILLNHSNVQTISSCAIVVHRIKLFSAFSTEDEETKKAKEMEIFTRRYVEMKRPDTSGNDQSYGVIPKFYYKVR